ncbi:MAG: ParA family protein, partial [Alphaproteobacteria bacterium]
IDGRTVMETDPEGRSATEIKELWAYIADRLAKSEPIPPPPLAATTSILRSTPIQVNALGQRMKSFGRRAVQ